MLCSTALSFFVFNVCPAMPHQGALCRTSRSTAQHVLEGPRTFLNYFCTRQYNCLFNTIAFYFWLPKLQRLVSGSFYISKLVSPAKPCLWRPPKDTLSELLKSCLCRTKGSRGICPFLASQRVLWLFLFRLRGNLKKASRPVMNPEQSCAPVHYFCTRPCDDFSELMQRPSLCPPSPPPWSFFSSNLTLSQAVYRKWVTSLPDLLLSWPPCFLARHFQMVPFTTITKLPRSCRKL